MKKLIIAAAIVCAAAMSQASAVMWGATASATYNGKTMYLLTSIADNYASLEAFESAAVDSKAVTRSGPVYQVVGHEAADDSITKSANFYLAIVDGNTIHYLDMTSAMQAKVYTPPETGSGQVTAVFADVANSTTTATIGGSPTPVPEPTSGLLLVLGVAGLALKRRRA